MRHNIWLEGYAYRLRPINDDDAEFVIDLRSNPKLNRYLHASSNKLEDQLAWFTQYYNRSDDYYFLLERQDNGVREGMIAIYEIDAINKIGEWGRWVLKPSSLAAVESVWLIYWVAFEIIKLKSVYCRTVAENTKVVSFHDSCGIVECQLLPNYFDINGRRMDAIEHRVNSDTWTRIRPRLEKLAQLTARKVHG